MTAENSRALRDLVVAVQGLAAGADAGSVAVPQVARTIRLAGPFIASLGGLTQLAVAELNSKAVKFEEECGSATTLKEVVDGEIRAGTERKTGSLSRCLVRMKRGAEFASLFFAKLISTTGESLVVPLGTAYDQVFGNFHGKGIRDTVHFCILSAPTKSQLLLTFGEDEQSAKVLMEDFINASKTVVAYAEGLFLETQQGTELLRMI